jgi:hypothetical protein
LRSVDSARLTPRVTLFGEERERDRQGDGAHADHSRFLANEQAQRKTHKGGLSELRLIDASLFLWLWIWRQIPECSGSREAQQLERYRLWFSISR